MSDIKSRPSDGSSENEEEKKEEKDELEEFLEKAEKDRKEREEENRKKIEALRKERGEDVSKDGETDPAKLKKVYVLKKKIGVFDRSGKNSKYNSERFNKDVVKKFKEGARRVSERKRENFMQLFNQYHNFKQGNVSTVTRDELIKFEAGLRKGASDEKFHKLCEDLKKKGVIKNSADVKRFFSKRELKMMRNSLTGQKDHNTYKRVDVKATNPKTGTTDKGQVAPQRPMIK